MGESSYTGEVGTDFGKWQIRQLEYKIPLQKTRNATYFCVHITKFQYLDFPEATSSWGTSEFQLKQQNIIVGTNTSGKSRTLRAIHNLARFIKQEQFFIGSFRAVFSSEQGLFEYQLITAPAGVTFEKLTLRVKQEPILLLQREADGSGRIAKFSEQKAAPENFRIPKNTLAINQKRDIDAFPYLELFHGWANSVFYFPFGTQMGQNSFLVSQTPIPPGITDSTQVVSAFKLGMHIGGPNFPNLVCEQMNDIGYAVTELSSAIIPFQRQQQLFPLPIPIALEELTLSEQNVVSPIPQVELSQGIFRTLSLIIQILTTVATNKQACILIDDLGEGLDFQRSSKLAKCIQRIVGLNQLIVTSNDQFILNAFPMDKWLLLKREGSHVRGIYKEANPELFQEFEETGLANFDFLTYDFTNPQA
jgi:hypothetical protein